RTFKHLLGETSLERKCRFIFGGGIQALVTLSFYWYGQKTEQLVIGQRTEAARVLVDPILLRLHLKPEYDSPVATLLDEWAGDSAPTVDRPNYESQVIDPRATKDSRRRPRDAFETEALARFLDISRHQPARSSAGFRPYAFPDGTPTELARIGP